MSETSKHEVAQTEAARPVKRSKRQTCARHCKRFWWIHLIIFICITVLSVCLVIFIGVPNIAQDKINDAKLKIQGVNIVDTTEESFKMEINSTITTDGSIGADIDAFEGDMYLEDLEPHTPFATLHFPETNGDKHQNVNISQEVKITDMDAFTTFNTWFVSNDTLRVTVKGKTKVKPHGLDRKYGVDFKKTVTLDGLKRFDGTEVTKGEINVDPDAEYNFNGTAIIPNQSEFTLDIGNVSFVTFIEDEEVGNLYIDNLILLPGDNHVDIKGNVDSGTVITIVRDPAYCKDGIVPFKLLGDNVTNHDQDISYFATALGSGNQTVPLNIKEIIANSPALKSATLGCAKD